MALKRQKFIELTTCRKPHKKVFFLNIEMHTVQNYKLSKTKQLY